MAQRPDEIFKLTGACPTLILCCARRNAESISRLFPPPNWGTWLTTPERLAKPIAVPPIVTWVRLAIVKGDRGMREAARKAARNFKKAGLEVDIVTLNAPPPSQCGSHHRGVKP